MRKTPLQRKTPLSRGTKPLERKPQLRAVDATDKPKTAKRKTPRDTGPSRKTRAALAARSGGVCEMCGRARAVDPHHRLGRKAGGTSRAWINELSNLIHVDRQCHRAVTNTNGRRTEYERNGWLLREGQDPTEVDVLLARDGRHDFYRLDNVGGVQLALWPEQVTTHPFDLDVPQQARERGEAA